MILALLWLTISAPFVFKAQQELEKRQNQAQNIALTIEDIQDNTEECNPFGNNTEEKTETNANSLSEYLHHIDELSHLAGVSPQHNCAHNAAVYVAFHGEMLCPPPNFLLS